MFTNVATGHAANDGGGDDRPPPHQIPTGCGGCLGNRGKGSQKPNFGGRRAGRMHTRQETRNLELKSITDKNGPVPIWFEFGDRETLMPLGDHTAHWSNYLGDLVRELPLHHSFWRQVSPKQKAGHGKDWDKLFQYPLYPVLTCVPIRVIRSMPKKTKSMRPPAASTKDLQWKERLLLKKMESSATREYPSLLQPSSRHIQFAGVLVAPRGPKLYILSSMHFLKFPENSFEVLKLLENSVEVLKILENKLESMRILENKLESLKLQEKQPVDGLVLEDDFDGKYLAGV
ncbi:hypothetical protein Tco_0712619 [Tanacetum coccineum]